MITQTIKIKNGTIVLPEQFRQNWKNKEVFFFPSSDTLVIKKFKKTEFKLSELPKKITVPGMGLKEINKEISAYRKSK